MYGKGWPIQQNRVRRLQREADGLFLKRPDFGAIPEIQKEDFP
jgi:hypothetical protein